MVDFFFSQIRESVNHQKNIITAFDADGTLWKNDVGKGFFKFLVRKKKLIKNISMPQKQFDSVLAKQGRKSALIWLAQSLAGFSLKEVYSWAEDFLKENPLKVFPFQKKLIQFFHSKNIPVFIVSSSVQWVLEPALKVFNIPQENIIGVRTLASSEGVITAEAVRPAPIQGDKIKALLKKTGGVPPFFSAGNTLADLSLLEAAKAFRMVVTSAGPDSMNYESEQKLKKTAKAKGWFSLEPHS